MEVPMVSRNAIRNTILALVSTASLASADVSLLVQEAAGGSGEFTGSGHVALYFSNICAETPVILRGCRDGEQGAVLSAYPTWGVSVPYKWLALPLNVFLYGVEGENNIPLYANGEIRRMLREEYRRRAMRGIIPDMPDGSLPEGRWTEIIGSTINRDVYGLTVSTTPEQDVRFLESFNRIPNTYHFNTMSDNCADFARETINLIFPHATHRDVLNDFGMTTPKALARTFTRYASARPKLLFRVVKYSQIDGPVRRSFNIRNFSEKGLVSKKYFLTMATTNPPLYGVFAVTYFMTGWYRLDHQYHEVPSLAVAELKVDSMLPVRPDFRAPDDISVGKHRAEIEHRIIALREETFGKSDFWNEYRNTFKPMLAEARKRGLFLDSAELQTFYKDLELQSEPALDANGGVILHVNDRGVIRTLGVTWANISESDSDPVLAYKLMLAKVNYILSAPARNRVSVAELAKDLALLQSLNAKVRSLPAPSLDSAGAHVTQPRFRQHDEVVSNGKRAQRLLVTITH